MKFYRQQNAKDCQIVPLQNAFSVLGVEKSYKEIKRALPKHSFGNLITELGLYLASLGFNCTIFSNDFSKEALDKNPPLSKSLEEFKKAGKFLDRKPSIKALDHRIAIVNVDKYKIARTKKSPAGHYVLLTMSDDFIKVCDGANFSCPVVRDFEEIYLASLDINRWHHDGMWLLISSDTSESDTGNPDTHVSDTMVSELGE